MEANPTNFTVATPSQNKPGTSFRIVFMLLLLVVLIIASATTYILATGKKPNFIPSQPTLQTTQENPFQISTTPTNPFNDQSLTPQTSTTNPFASTSSASSNPFDQFEAGSSATSPSPGGYQNPF